MSKERPSAQEQVIGTDLSKDYHEFRGKAPKAELADWEVSDHP